MQDDTLACSNNHSLGLQDPFMHPNVLMNAPIGCFTSSPEGRFLSVNKAMARMLGYPTPSELVESITDIELQVYANPDERERFKRFISSHREVIDCESLWLRRNGKPFWVSVNVRAIVDQNGNSVYYLGFATDISRRKNLEAKLLKKTELLQSVTDNMSDLVSLTDMKGNIKFIGRSHKILGYDLDYLKGKNFLDFIHPDDHYEISIAFKEFITNLENGRKVEYRHRCADGNYLWFETVGRFITDDAGNPLGILLSTRDITERKNTEKVLLENDMRMHGIIQGFPIPAFVIDKNHRILHWNKALEVLSGMRADTVIGTNHHWRAFYNKSRPCMPDFIVDGATDEIPRWYKGKYVHSKLIPDAYEGVDFFPALGDGGKWLRYTAAPIKEACGSVIGAIETLEDMTDNVEAEKRLLDQKRNAELAEKKWETTFNAMADAIALIDNNHRITRVNQAMAKRLNCDPAEIVGKFCYEVMHGAAKPTFYCPHVKMLASGKMERAEAYEERLAGFFEITATPIRDPDGQLIGSVHLAHDITHRKWVEDALRESEKKYRTLFREMHNGFALHEILCDDSGRPVDYRFVAVNPAFERMTGLKSETVIGKTVLDILPETEPYWIETCGKVALTGEPVTFDNYSMAFRKHFEVTAFRPAPNYFACIFTDISERKRTEGEREKLQTQLFHSQKMESVGRLAGGVAHDFNNMLGTIFANIEVVKDELDPEEPIYACVQDIQTAAKRSADLVRQLLAFARKQTNAPIVLDLNENITSLLKMIARLIGENITLDWRPGKSLWTVKMDPSQIDQILANLCVNASDAITDYGKILIETDNAVIGDEDLADHPYFIPGEYVMLTVSDNGSGMDESTMYNLFEPFFTTKKVGKGTGLGLSTVYGIIKQNNGFITVDSELNQGSCFRIYLPKNSGIASAPKHAPDMEPSMRGTETVLLVEDEPIILDAFLWQLKKLGYSVLAAELPEKAIRMAEDYSGPIHLLITDVVMPEMCGPDLANNLKTLYPDIKCLFMSGYTDDIITHHGVLEEGSQFIEKPFSMRDFAAKVRETLQKT